MLYVKKFKKNAIFDNMKRNALYKKLKKCDIR